MPLRERWNGPWILLALLTFCLPAFALRGEQSEERPDKKEATLSKALEGPMAGVDEIVFALRKQGTDGHWYANFSYYAPDENRLAYAEGGQLCRLNLRTGELKVLVDDPVGGVRDPKVHYDGKKILFAWRKGKTKNYHLYEINTDGTGLRQLTDGPYDDFECTYLPDGDIMFISSRCKRWVQCWLTQVAIIYRCDSDGKNIRQVSGNLEQDNTPWLLPDGRVLYQRWEYVDRSQVHYHHLWTMNPDGTGQMAFFGNMHPGTVMIDAKPIPGTGEVLSIFSPGHGRKEHQGALAIVDPGGGPDRQGYSRQIPKTDNCRDPFAFSEDCFIAARDTKVLLIDDQGRIETVYELPEKQRKEGFWIHEPRPIVAHARERVIPQRIDPTDEVGRLVLANVYEGRNMAGVKPGEIKKLLIIESLPKPINFTGGMEPLSYGGTFTLERVLGSVPVEADGSAYFEVPALRSVFFVALDENDLSVKRMQSFASVQPGELTSCVGCHEHRSKTTFMAGKLLATQRAVSRIEPIEGVPDVYDFPRDIQPILDRHCVGCHRPEKREGDVLLTGDRGPLYSHSYFTLSARRQLADGRNLPKSNYPPRAIGSSASRLLNLINEGHYNVRLSEREKTIVRLWIETGAPYPGTYAALGSGMIGGYAQNNIDRSDTEWESMKTAMEAMKNRCGECHTGKMKLPTSPSDNLDMPPWSINYSDPRLRFSRHILYNLSRPEKSLLLLAPLSRRAGGYAICRHEPEEGSTRGRPVFRNTSDEDYQKILAAIEDTRDRLDQIKRFDMPGFRPRDAYVREMKRFGILPQDFAADAEIDVYATDRAYWKSLWWHPARDGSQTGNAGAM